MEHEQLIQKCKEKDLASQRELYNLYANTMMGICIRYASSYTEAKELMKEGFVQVFKQLGSYKGEESLEAWMRMVITNCCLMELRKKVGFAGGQASESHEPTNGKSYSLETDDVLKFVQELPPEIRMVFNLHVVEGYKHKKVAQFLNITEELSKSRYVSARKLLEYMAEKEKSYGTG